MRFFINNLARKLFILSNLPAGRQGCRRLKNPSTHPKKALGFAQDEHDGDVASKYDSKTQEDF
ncbi:MAG: hypothetical protein HYV29_07125 [Ignavibacteriales bacterium]|nr:hypothetical protein [Ignavibacteriales bacterium]